MKTNSAFAHERILYSLIFGMAVFLRLLLLGNTPLIDSEASIAYQAWQILQEGSVPIGSQVGYLSLTKSLFYIFGAGEFLARLWPAFVGSILVLIPYFFREKLGPTPALIMAAGMAIDPALVSASRIAGSPVPALVFVLLTLAAFHKQNMPLAFTFLGLGLMSGPGFWLGAVILGIFYLIWSRLEKETSAAYLKNRLKFDNKDGSEKGAILDYAIPGLVLLTVGSFFFTHFQGLSSWPVSVIEFMKSWTDHPSLTSPGILIRLLVSSPLPVIFGFLCFANSWREGERLGRLSSIWFATTLVILLLYPGRQPVDLIWLMVPLWIGSAKGIVHHIRQGNWTWPVWVLAGLIGVLMILNWLTFIGMIFQGGNQRALLLQGGLLAASLALVILALTITASEWDWSTAKKGLTLGSIIILLFYMISATTQGAYLRSGDARSLWSDGSGAGQMELLLDTVSEVSISQTGRWDSIEGKVLNPDDSLRWLFRDLDLEYIETYHHGDLPPILVTAEHEGYLVPKESYRGQDFVIRTKPAWQGLIPTDWISWIAFRDGPITNEYIILWVRGDILTVDQ